MSRARLAGPTPAPTIRFVVRISETGTGRTAAEFECDTQLQAEQGAALGLRILPVGRDHVLFAELTAEMRDSSGRAVPVAHAARRPGKLVRWWMDRPAEVAPSLPGGASRVPESTEQRPEPGGDSLPVTLADVPHESSAWELLSRRQVRTTSDILRMRKGSRS